MDPTQNKPASETPAFMSGIIDPTEQQLESQEILKNPDADTPPAGDQPPADNPPAADNPPTDDQPPADNPPADDQPPAGDQPPADNPPTDQPPAGDKPAGDQPPASDEPPAKTPEQIEIEKKETIDRSIDRSLQNKEINEHLQNLVSKPLIKIEVPDPEIYKEKDGSFDVQTYLKDALTKMVVELQKSMAGGSLGAIQFGILKRGIQEESEERINAIKSDEAAKNTWDKLTKKFPILKTDEIADKFERAVYGEKARRAAQFKAENKPYVDLGYVDYEKLAAEVIGGQPSPAPAPKQPVEVIPGGPQLNGEGVKNKDPVGDDIDAMIDLKGKKGVLF